MRTMRRVAVAFAAFFVLVITGAVTVISWIAAMLGGAPHAPNIGAVAAVGFAIVAFGFVATMRRVGLPYTDVVSAAGRVADGDYAVRVAERGPRSLRSVARAFNGMTAQLQAQDEQRRNLMADIAHELRTPLTVMQGQLEGIVDGVYARDDDRLNEVLEQAQLLSRLVEDLRTLAHAERGTLALAKEPVDLGALVEDTAASFAGEGAAKDVAIRVVHGAAGAPGPATDPAVNADPIRIREVLINLLSNALRHTPRGGAVTVAIEPRGDAVAVSIRDTGAGIPPDVLPRIFDRFYKDRSSPGSGLGLTIARNFIVAHGGTISAGSTPGSGTTITFTLPIAAA
jgi:two-component system OmpR family sensor kinase/two-component system sensor histidine kinase BaeS